MRTYRYINCNRKICFDVGYTYGFVWWGFVPQVDDVIAWDSLRAVTPARAAPQYNGYALLWKRYDNNRTKWRLHVTIETLRQQQINIPAIRLTMEPSWSLTSSVYDCTVEDVFTTELVTDVFYIFNSTVVDWTCFFLSLLQIKHQLFHLCNTYFRVLYEVHSATFLQQLRNMKGFKYFEHSK